MVVPPESLPPRPGPLAVAVGAARVGATLVLAAVGTVVLGAAALVPWPRGRVRPAEWAAVGVARACLAIAGVRRETAGLGALRAHDGFVFFNHLSYLDPVVLVAAAPVRFLSTAGVRRLPFVGPMARALGTIFVDRGRGASRSAARDALRAAVHASPVPVALAPEGRIGPGPDVLPFRHGAFEVAADADAPVLLVALRYRPHPFVVWQDGEWVLRAYWRLCARTGPLTASLDVVGVAPEAGEAAGRARAAEAVLNGAVVRPAGPSRDRPRIAGTVDNSA